MCRTFLNNEELLGLKYWWYPLWETGHFFVVLVPPSPHLVQSSCQSLFWKLLFKSNSCKSTLSKEKVQLCFIEITTHYLFHTYSFWPAWCYISTFWNSNQLLGEYNISIWSKMYRHELRKRWQGKYMPGGSRRGQPHISQRSTELFEIEGHCQVWQVRSIWSGLWNVHWICQVGCLLTLVRLA